MKKAVTSAVSAQRRESSDFELQFWSVTGFGRVRPRTSCVPFFRESVESEARVVASRHYRKRQRVDQSDQTPSPANACLYAHKLVDDPTAAPKSNSLHYCHYITATTTATATATPAPAPAPVPRPKQNSYKAGVHV